MEQAIVGLLVGISGLLTAGGIGARLLFKRMEKLETDSERHQKAIREERDALKRQVADLEVRVAKVPQLEKQIATLIQQLAEMQERQAETEKALAEANDREKVLRRENDELRSDRDKWKQEAHDLKTANETFERVLKLLGMERLELDKEGETPPRNGDAKEPARAEQTEG